MHLYAAVAPWVQLFSSWLRLWWRFSLITNCVFFHTLGRHRFAMSLNFAVSMVWLLVPWDNINDYIYLWFFPCYVARQEPSMMNFIFTQSVYTTTITHVAFKKFDQYRQILTYMYHNLKYRKTLCLDCQFNLLLMNWYSLYMYFNPEFWLWA